MLPDTQQQFIAAIFDRDTQILKKLLPSRRLSESDRFEIYRGSIFGLYTNTLADIYPVCKRLLGTRFFNAMCDHYIPLYRSTSPNLQDYGQPFANFLLEFVPVKNLTYLPDLAKLEWSWHTAFHAENSKPLAMNQLNVLSEHQMNNIVFQLAPGAALLHSHFPIHDIWQTNQANIEEPPAMKMVEDDYYLFVWRIGFDIKIERLNINQWHLMKAIEAQQSLLEIHESDLNIPLNQVLPDTMTKGCLTGYSLKQTN